MMSAGSRVMNVRVVTFALLNCLVGGLSGANAQEPPPEPPLGPVEQVRDAAGGLVEPYQEAEACTGDRCGAVIYNHETGDIAYFDGLWMTGYVETGNGAEVVRSLEASARVIAE